MAKKLLLDSLTKVLGGIVEGINEENLKVGVWSGKVVLKNVALNVDAFKEREDLPIHVYSGSVELLELFIPWTSLASEPVKIKISGVYLLVGPYNKEHLNQKSCQQRLSDTIRSKLLRNDKEHLTGLLQNHEQDNQDDQDIKQKEQKQKEQGWAASLIMKIVDNIQITVESLHIRYEQCDDRGKCFACGLTINQFTVRSTNKEWEDVEFQTRNKGETKLYKKAKLLNLAIYLENNAQNLCQMANQNGGNSVRESMNMLIARNEMNGVAAAAADDDEEVDVIRGLSQESYILSPLSVEVCAVRNETPSKILSDNNYAVTASLRIINKNGFDLSLRKHSYHKLLLIFQSFTDLNEKIYILGHPTRPKVPISKKKNGNPKEWFQFLVNLVSHRNEGNTHVARMIKFKQLIMKTNPKLKKIPSTLEIKKLYLKLSKRLLHKIERFPNLLLKPLYENIENEKMNYSQLDESVLNVLGDLYEHDWLIDGNEIKTFQLLEETLPIEILISLIQEGNIQLEFAERKMIEMNKQKKLTQKSWWQFGKSNQNEMVLSDDLTIEKIVRQQGAKASEMIAAGQIFTEVPIPSMKCFVDTFGVFKLYNSDDLKETLMMSSTSSLNSEVSIDMTNNSYDAVLQLSNLEISDHVTNPNPIFKKIISTKVDSVNQDHTNTFLWYEPNLLASSTTSSAGTDDVIGFGNIRMPKDKNSDIVIGVQDKKNKQGIHAKLRSRSFIFSLNEPFVAALSEYFNPPVDDGVIDDSGAVKLKLNLGKEISQLTSKQFEQATQFAQSKLNEYGKSSVVKDVEEEEDGTSSNITVDLIAGAPKIVLLVSPTQDVGCLLLDCGTLSIVGTIGSDIKTTTSSSSSSLSTTSNAHSCSAVTKDVLLSQWQVRLSDINARMGNKNEIFDIEHKKGDILKKFDVDVVLKLRAAPPPLPVKFSSESSKPLPNYVSIPTLEVDCSLLKPISGGLSPNQLNDLLYILMNIGKSQEQHAKINTDSRINYQREFDSGIDLSASQNSFNPFAVSLKAKVFLKQVELTLMEEKLASSSSSSSDVVMKPLLSVQLSEMKVRMVNRSEDMVLRVALNSMSLFDLSREKENNTILSSNDEFNENLVFIEFINVLTSKSPLLKLDSKAFIGKKINVKFGTMKAMLLKSSIVRLKPYYDNLLSAGQLSSNDKLNDDIVLKNQLLQQNEMMKQIDLGGGRTEVELVIQQVSAEVATEVASHTSMRIVPIIRCAVNQLKCNVILTPEELRAKVILSSLSVVDVRDEAKTYLYKHIIAPSSTDISDSDSVNQPPLSDKTKPLNKNDSLSSFIETTEYETFEEEKIIIASDEVVDIDEEDINLDEVLPLLVLDFYSNKITNQSLIDIKLNEFHSYFIIPSFNAALDVILDLKLGIDYLIADLNDIKEEVLESSNTESLSPISETNSSSSTTNVVVGTCPENSLIEMKVNICVSEVSLIIVENPSRKNTSGIVFEAQTSIEYTNTIEQIMTTNKQMNKMDLKLNIENLEAFIDIDMSQSSKLHILDPNSFSLKLYSEAVNSYTIITDVQVTTYEDIRLRISFEDVVLAMQIMNAVTDSINAITVVAAQDKIQNENQEMTNHDKVNEMNNLISTLNFVIKTKNIYLEFIDDSENKALPLLRFKINNCDIHLSGNVKPQKSLFGTIQCNICCDVFNHSFGLWEEFIESWFMDFKIKLTNSIHLYELNQLNQRLNISLSDSLLIKILNIVNTLTEINQKQKKILLIDNDVEEKDILKLKLEQEKKLKTAAENRIAPPYKFMNRTGYHIDVFIDNQVIANVQSNTTQAFSLKKKSLLKSSSSASKLKLNMSLAVKAAAEDRRALSQLAIGQQSFASKISVLIQDDEIGPRKPIGGIVANVVNSGRYMLLPDIGGKDDVTTTATTSVVTRTVIEEIWQYQRRNEVSRNWNPPFMFGDPYEFSDAARSKEVLKESVKLPQQTSVHQWRWYNDWSVHPVDTTLSDEECNISNVDEDGWEYGTSFENMSRGRYSERSLKRDFDTVRRRRWTRIRGVIPPPLSMVNRPIKVFIETLKDTANSGLLIRASSGIRIENHSGVTLEYGAESPGCWDGILPFGTAHGNGGVVFLPLKLGDASDILLREVGSGSSSTASSTSTWSVGNKIPLVGIESTFAIANTPKLVYLPSLTKSSSHAIAFTYNYEGNDMSSCLSIELHPSVVLMNKLPCALEYAIGNKELVFDNYPKQNAGLVSICKIKASDIGKQTHVPWYDDESLILAIRLNGYNWSEYIPFGGIKQVSEIIKSQSEMKSDNEDPPLEIELESPNGDMLLSLLLKFSLPSPGRIVIEIYSKFWISNRTGLFLSFGSKGALTKYKRKIKASVPNQTLTNHEEEDISSEDWALNRNGLGLLHSSKSHIVVAMDNNTKFARPNMTPEEVDQLKHDFNISQTLSMSNDSLKADNVFAFKCGDRLIELCMSVNSLPNPFNCSKLVVFRNKYVMLNVMESETLLVRQEDTPLTGGHVIEIPPRGKALLHWSNYAAPKRLLFKLKNESNWSYGGLPVEAIGGNAIWLPPTSTKPVIDASEFQTLQVEVQLAEESEDSCMNIVIWKLNSLNASQDQSSSSFGHPLLSCRNCSNYPLEYRQVYRISKVLNHQKKLFLNAIRWILKPGEEMHFGWLIPTDPKVIYVSLEEDKMSEMRFEHVNKLANQLAEGGSGGLFGLFEKKSLKKDSNLNDESTHQDEMDQSDWNDGHMECLDETDDLDISTHLSSPQPSTPSSLKKQFTDNQLVQKSKQFLRREDHVFELMSVSKGKATVLRRKNNKKALAMAVVACGGTIQLLAASGGQELQQVRKIESVNSEDVEEGASSLSSSSLADKNPSKTPIIDTQFRINFKHGLGISIIDDNGDGVGFRREILFILLQGIKIHSSSKPTRVNNHSISKIEYQSELQFSINHLQIDNHLKNAPYKVLMIGKGRMGKDDKDQINDEENDKFEPFIQTSFIYRGMDSVPYLAVRMAPLWIEIDLGTVLKLSQLILPILANQQSSIKLAKYKPKEFLKQQTQSLTLIPFLKQDFNYVLSQIQQSRIHFQCVTIHPVLVHLTFVDATDLRLDAQSAQVDETSSISGQQNSFISFGNRKVDLNENQEENQNKSFLKINQETIENDKNPISGLGGTFAQILLNMASVNRAPLKLNSFAVSDAIESQQTMQVLIQKHYLRGMLSQIMSLAGSMAALGNPVDLVSNVGGGVSSLFYEPYQGLVLGPKEFVKGIGRGGKGFVDGLFHGVASSVAGVGDTVNKNLSMLTMDDDYQAERRRSRQQANEEGFGQGLKTAGSNVFGGLASGIGGIVTAPIKGAKQEGVGGFFKGVGKGLVGAVVKPVVGVTEGVTAVVQSVSNVTDGNIIAKTSPVRPRRALPLLSGVGYRMVVVAYNKQEALAQSYTIQDEHTLNLSVKKMRKSKQQKPNLFMGSVSLKCQHDNHLALSVIVTTKRLFLRISSSPDDTNCKQASISWNDITKCLPSSYGVILYFYSSIESMLKTLHLPSSSLHELILFTTNEQEKTLLYELLLRKKNDMGDPASMTESVSNAPSLKSMSLISNVTSKFKKTSGEGASGGNVTADKPYVFGSINGVLSLSLSSTESQYEEGRIFDYCRECLVTVKSSMRQNKIQNNKKLNEITNYQKSILDEGAWNCVRLWMGTHKLINFKKICVLVFINESGLPVQISEPYLLAGQAIRVISDPDTYDVSSKTLEPGGCLFVLAWSYGPNPFKKQHVLYKLDTSATNVVVSDMKSKITSTAKDGYHSGLLEVSIAENKDWSKVVVSVTSR